MKFIFYKHNAILINILSLIGYFIKIEIYCYNCHKCKKKLERPVSRDYYKIVDSCHISIKNFNNQISENKNYNEFLKNYFSKLYELYSIQYSAFNHSINKTKRNIIIAPRAYKILFNKKNKNSLDFFFDIYNSFKGFSYFLIYFFFCTICVIFTKKKFKFKKIIFLRKKNLEDNIGSKFKKHLTNDISLLIPIFSNGSAIKDYGYINSFVNLRKITLCFYITLKFYFLNINYIYKNILFFSQQEEGKNVNIIYNLLRDYFISLCIKNINTKIYIGILADKPLHLFINSNKYNDQKIFSLNETFTFPPKKGFDYNYLDKYYSLNKYDEITQNIYSGNIKEFKRVNFFRKNLNSINLSKNLLTKISKFRKTILVIPCQIYNERYSGYSNHDLKFFIKGICNIAYYFQDTLFIFKEKKGELKLFENFIKKNINKNNLYFVRCDNPKKQLYDNFDSLLSKSDLLLSIAFNSTTIWQSIINNQPFCVYNDFIPKTFLNKYENIINNNEDELMKSINYWLNISDRDFKNFQKKIFAETNINLFSDGIIEIINDLKKHIQ